MASEQYHNQQDKRRQEDRINKEQLLLDETDLPHKKPEQTDYHQMTNEELIRLLKKYVEAGECEHPTLCTSRGHPLSQGG
jgi:RecB family exonuclease